MQMGYLSPVDAQQTYTGQNRPMNTYTVIVYVVPAGGHQISEFVATDATVGANRCDAKDPAAAAAGSRFHTLLIRNQ